MSELKSSSSLQFDELSVLKIQNELLLEENKRLQQEINTLTSSKQSKLKIDYSDEEIIAHMQLERLRMKAMEQELTLEEIKKYDLLVKNKRLSEDKSTINADYKKLPENIDDESLIQIAASASAIVKNSGYEDE